MDTVDSFAEKFYRKFIELITGSQPSTVVKTSVVYMIGLALAVPLYFLQETLFYQVRAALPDQSPEELLERHGVVKGVTRNNGQFFQGIIQVTFESGGGSIAADAIFLSESGERFFLVDGQTLTTTSEMLSLNIRSESVGVASQLNAGDELVLNVLNSSVASIAVESVATQAADREALEDYRQRVLAEYRRKPYAGTPDNFRQELEDFSFVSRIFVVTAPSGIGSVDVYGINYQNESDFTLTAAELLEITRRCTERLVPGWVTLSVENPTQVSLNLQITVDTGLSTDTNTQNNLKAALQTYLEDNALVKGSFKDGITTETGEVSPLGVVNALSQVAGFKSVSMASTGSDALSAFSLSNNFEPSNVGEIITVGDLTYAE